MALVGPQRLALCDQLEDLDAAQWEVASLCAGWRTRDVLGHLVSVLDVPTYRMLLGAFGPRSFHRRVDRFARDYGQRPPAALIARYRELANGPKVPPVLGPIAPLTDVTVHALDVQRPLGLDRTTSDEATGVVLDALAGGLLGFTSKRLGRGLRFVAPDVGWAAGSGPLVEASSDDLLLAFNGRAVDRSAFTGAGASEFSARLGA